MVQKWLKWQKNHYRTRVFEYLATRYTKPILKCLSIFLSKSLAIHNAPAANVHVIKRHCE